MQSATVRRAQDGRETEARACMGQHLQLDKQTTGQACVVTSVPSKETHTREEWSSSTSRTIMGRNSPNSTFPADFWENPGRTDSYWVLTKHSTPKVISLNSRGHCTPQIRFITNHYPSDLTLPYEVWWEQEKFKSQPKQKGVFDWRYTLLHLFNLYFTGSPSFINTCLGTYHSMYFS